MHRAIIPSTAQPVAHLTDRATLGVEKDKLSHTVSGRDESRQWLQFYVKNNLLLSQWAF